jgi:uncharacterized membrane protein
MESVPQLPPLGMIALHNLLDGVRVEGWKGPGTPAPGFLDGLWMVLHQPYEVLPLFGASGPVVVLYPLLPWGGVMAAGFAFGAVYRTEGERRRKILLRLGAGMVAAFVVLRALNVYGDPARWEAQESAFFTGLSFLNTTKYPASLLFLLMTLGPALLALAWFERTGRGPVARALVTFGRVPLFFYLLQWPVAKGMGIVASLAAGKEVGYFFLGFPDVFTQAPPGAGFDLWVVYLCWAAGVALLFPLCRGFAEVKRRRKDWWLSYL